jgi:polysaccharide pyruvyl transferase WcaK-like protein
MPYCDPRSYYPEKNELAYSSFMQALTLFGVWLLEQQFALNLFCSDIGTDPPVVNDLEARLRGAARHDPPGVAAVAVESLDDLLSAISSMEYVITSRFHGVVFAHLLGKPVIALSYHAKTRALMSRMGLSAYCLDLHNIDLAGLQTAFVSLLRNSAQIKRDMAEELAHYKRALGEQFDGLFPPCEIKA